MAAVLSRVHDDLGNWPERRSFVRRSDAKRRVDPRMTNSGGFVRSPVGFETASQPLQTAALQPQQAVLRDIEAGRLLLGKAGDEAEEAADDAAMRDADGRLPKFGEPWLYPLKQHLVAFGALSGRLEIPLCVAAAVGRAGGAFLELGEGKTLPVAETYLHQTRIGAVGGRIESHSFAHELHRLARAPHRAGDKVETVALADELSQPSAVLHGLLAAKVVEVGVGLALQAVLGIPLGLAVARDVDERVHQVFRRSGQGLDGE
ncbi:hypothetical protein MPL3365_200057 [Mesorhizobium plurifarium]|uniref:Uncharacterized protein n=1 Tax=Mesorhizobium plurifarium TaxID=69974 RepID=A0A090GU61_MESPL|nr:hypothetical protein MPL3365_200057 [Mesorhizobium plurifarium]